MRTQINVKYLDYPDIQEADDILRTCVHCGFCNATCPTYQELGDERDGPRGRIYLLKQMLETGDVSEKSQLHLDRCLTCRSCETTCPSGVKYGRLAEIGRDIMEEQVSRPADQRLKRWLIRQILPYPNRFRFLLRLGQLFRSFLPRDLKDQIPIKQITRPRPSQQHSRQMLVLEGCAQPSATPNTNNAAARVLDKLGISLIAAPDAGCCGAVSYHLPSHEEGLAFMRRNIDAWWPCIDAGVEAIVISASGCGSMVKEYGEKLKHDDAYAAKAKHISALTRDLSEILIKEDLEKLVVKQTSRKTAVHCPCSLQHAQQLGGHVEEILQRTGIELSKTQNGHLCCGSAGTYSLLQPKLSQQLLTNKIIDLTIDNPEQIVTANVGCQLHLGSHASIPVKHWIELLDQQ